MKVFPTTFSDHFNTWRVLPSGYNTMYSADFQLATWRYIPEDTIFIPITVKTSNPTFEHVFRHYHVGTREL